MERKLPTLETLVRDLKMQPLPFEGGWYAETWRSASRYEPAGYPGLRSSGSAIFYLMTPAPDGFSALHRLRGDEVFHFYLGDPVETLLIYPDGSHAVFTLGHDITSGQVVQLVVPAGTWQGHRVLPGGTYALIGTTLAPAYDPADFELGARAELCRLHPELSTLITSFSRG